MADVLRTSIKTILLAIIDRLVAREVQTADRIFVTIDPQSMPHLMGDHDIVLHLGREIPHERFDEGSGRHDCRRNRTINIFPRTRLLQDPAAQHKYWLTQEEGGHIPNEDAIFDALHLWTPKDEDDNELTVQAVRFGPITEPVPARGMNREWGGSQMALEVVYVRDLTDADNTDQDW